MLFGAPDAKNVANDQSGILSRMEAFYAESITLNQSFWGEADTDTRFMEGDQTLWNDIYGNLPATRRRQFNFNRIRRVVNMISGHQRRTRKSTIVVPVENADDQTADQFTKLLLWLNTQEGILETISESFQGSLVTGLNLLHVWMDWRADPVSGNIKVDNCHYNSFLIDPYFRKSDLSDCRAIWKRSFLTKREAAALLPDHEDEIWGLAGSEGTSRDGKFQFMPESYNYGYKTLLAYDEYYYRDFRSQKMLIDTQTGESQEWQGSDDDLDLFLRTYPQITTIKQDIPTTRLAIVVEGRVFYDGPNPMGIDEYPFVPVFAYYNPQMPYFPWRIQGVVRGLRDAQYLYNRRRQIELDILESQLNSGWIYKENALVNPKDIFLSGQGRGIALKEEAAMTDVQKIMPAEIPGSMIQLSELLAREVMEISGVNEELLGSATDDKAGILSMLRQGAGLTTLQIFFDQLDHAQKLLGKICIKLIQNNFMPGKVARILNADPTPEFYNKSFGRYDAAVEEGLNTSTQKQMQFAQLIYLKEAGVPVPDDALIEAATIQNKKQLTDSIMQSKQKAEQQQNLEKEIIMAQTSAQTQLAQASAIAEQGLGVERLSRVRENQALADERRAQTQLDHERALLERVKALKELDDIDLNQISKIVHIWKLMQQQTAEKKFTDDALEQASAALGSAIAQPAPPPTQFS